MIFARKTSLLHLLTLHSAYSSLNSCFSLTFHYQLELLSKWARIKSTILRNVKLIKLARSIAVLAWVR